MYEGNSRNEKNKMQRKGYKLIATAKCDCEEGCGTIEGVYGKKVKGIWKIIVTDTTGEYPQERDDLETLFDVKCFLKGRYYGSHILSLKFSWK